MFGWWQEKLLLRKRIKELEMKLDKAIDEKIDLQFQLDKQVKYESTKNALLKAFGEMVAEGATELSYESYGGGHDKVCIKREITT